MKRLNENVPECWSKQSLSWEKNKTSSPICIKLNNADYICHHLFQYSARCYWSSQDQKKWTKVNMRLWSCMLTKFFLPYLLSQHTQWFPLCQLVSQSMQVKKTLTSGLFSTLTCTRGSNTTKIKPNIQTMSDNDNQHKGTYHKFNKKHHADMQWKPKKNDFPFAPRMKSEICTPWWRARSHGTGWVVRRTNAWNDKRKHETGREGLMKNRNSGESGGNLSSAYNRSFQTLVQCNTEDRQNTWTKP